jgi:hypothetical protein
MNKKLFIVALVKQKNKQSPLFLVKYDQKNLLKIYPNQRLSTIRRKSKQRSYLDICFASMNRPNISHAPNAVTWLGLHAADSHDCVTYLCTKTNACFKSVNLCCHQRSITVDFYGIDSFRKLTTRLATLARHLTIFQ